VQAIIPLSDPGARNPQAERRRASLSGSGYSVSPDLAQSQSSPNPPGQAGQQDQPIRVKTELIDLRAVVTDKRGQSITDLKKEDFELMENGKPREVNFFSVVKIPGRGEARQTVNTPAIGTTGVPAVAARPAESIGRTVLLYVDTLHLSPQSLLSVKQSLRKFIGERLTDQDLTAIVTSAGSLGVVEQFTRDRRVLRYAVDRLSSRPNARASLFTPYIASMVDRGSREAMQVARAIYIAEENALPDPSITQLVQMRAKQILSEATYLRRATLITLKEVVQRLSDMPGQRLLVMVSDGFTLFDTGGGQDTNDLQSVTSRAVRSGVVIYSIDAKGLQPTSLFSASLGNIPNDPRISSYVSAGERDLENGLNALAKDTGGEAFFNTNDTAGAMGRALDDNQVYYTLGYYPAIDESDKKFRKITIKVKSHPEYKVRAQRGYLPADLAKKAKEEEAKTPRQRFVNAILAPLPLTDIGVTVIPDFIEVPEDNAQVSLQIYIDGKTLTYREEDGRRRFDAEIVTIIYNSDGKRVDLKSENISSNLTPERMEIAKQSGLRYDRRVQLKPGLYQIRVGVTEPANERAGTAAAWIETPDLSKKNKLAISSLFLSDAVAMGIQEAASNNEPGAASTLSKMVQGVRYYKASQPVVYFFRLYNLANDQAEAGAVMQIEIMQDDKMILTAPWQPVTTRQIGKDTKGLLVGGQLAMENIQPGIYDMRVSIKDAKMKRPIQRSAPFGIEP
jgi:VWFA-related protein